MRSRLLRNAFLMPVLLAMAITSFYPIVLSILSSLVKWRLTRPDLGVRFAGLGNYSRVIEDGYLTGAMGRTLVFLVIAVTIEMSLGIGLGLLLNRDFHGKSAVVAVLTLPMMLTPVALSYMWKYMLNSEQGIVNYFFSIFGWGAPVWLQSVRPMWLSFMTIVIVDVWQWTPFVFLLVLAGLATVPQELTEAATVDGASTWQVNLHIVIPAIRPTLLVAALLRCIGCLKEFDKIFILTKGGPGTVTELLSYRVFITGLQQFDMGQAGVMATVMLLVTLVLCMAYLSITRRALWSP